MGRSLASGRRLPAIAPARSPEGDHGRLLARLLAAINETSDRAGPWPLRVAAPPVGRPAAVIVTHVEWPEPDTEVTFVRFAADTEELGQELLALARRYEALDGIWLADELMAWDPDGDDEAPTALVAPTLRGEVSDFQDDGRYSDPALLQRRARTFMRRFAPVGTDLHGGGGGARFAVMGSTYFESAEGPEDRFVQEAVAGLAAFMKDLENGSYLDGYPCAFIGLYDLDPARGQAPRELRVRLGVDITIGGVIHTVWESS